MRDHASEPRQGQDVEDDFVSPLTMIRGVLEMLREGPDLPDAARRRFLDLALDDCDRLGESINRLIEANPDAIKRTARAREGSVVVPDRTVFERRVSFDEDERIVEVDFSDFGFSSSAVVNGFHDVIDGLIEATGRKWYVMVNFRNCTIAPEAWVAFAHRGRKTNLAHSLGTVRYAVPVDTKHEMLEQSGQPAGGDAMFRSRQAAIDFLRRERASAGS